MRAPLFWQSAKRPALVLLSDRNIGPSHSEWPTAPNFNGRAHEGAIDLPTKFEAPFLLMPSYTSAGT
jgi:hypothetical protein